MSNPPVGPWNIPLIRIQALLVENPTAFEPSDFKVNVLPTPVNPSDMSSKTWLVA